MHITSKSNFFKNEVVVKLTDEAVIFQVADESLATTNYLM